MAETFNPIISHLYSGQGGVSREITKYNNATISEINVVDNGVTTKYDFGGKYVEKMYSGYRVWNQLLQSFFDTKTVNDVTITNNTTYLTINGTASATVDTGLAQINGFIGGHKYAFITDMVGMSGNLQSGYQIYCYSAEVGTPIFNKIHQANGSGNIWLYLKCQSGVTISNKNAHINIHDLTLIYGAGNEPTTVAEFVHDYPELYYPYDAGTNFSIATKLFNTIKQPLDSIKFYGNTMRWCQLVKNGNFESTNNWTATYFSFTVNNNVASLTASSSSAGFNQDITLVSGHKYFVTSMFKLSSVPTGSIWLRIKKGSSNVDYNLDTSSTNWQFINGFFTADGTNGQFYVRDNSTSDWVTIQIQNAQLFDLTYIFGAGNEPTTVSDFTRRLKKLYYPFTDGEILSIEKASEYLYGINIWDEEWEVGRWGNGDYTDKVEDSGMFRNKTPIMVLPNTTYCVVGVQNSILGMRFYDGAGNRLTTPVITDSTGYVTFTTPASCIFINFFINNSATYNNDICINLSDSSINGTYEASKGEQKMQLDSFNVWDEEWELGMIGWSNGANADSSSNIRSKNYIPIVGGSTHYVEIPTGRVEVFYYDYNKGFIGYSPSSLANQIFTPPASACYIRFYTQQAYGTTYNHDICINLSDPSHNGIYVPYRGYVELNGINDAIDTVTVEKNVTLPFGLVDLGELTWYYLEASGHEAMYSTGIQSSAKHPSSDSTVANIICGVFSTVTRNQQYNHSADFIIAMNTDGTLFVYSTTMGTTGASFKDSVKGKYLYYELADYPLNDTPILAGSYVRRIGEYTFTGNESVGENAPGNYYITKSSLDIGQVSSGIANYNIVSNGEFDQLFVNEMGAFRFYKSIIESVADMKTYLYGKTIYYELATPVETTLTAQQCAEILNGAFTKSKYSTLLTDNDNGQIDQTVDVGMWEQR